MEEEFLQQIAFAGTAKVLELFSVRRIIMASGWRNAKAL
jgi:hypothetical protein